MSIVSSPSVILPDVNIRRRGPGVSYLPAGIDHANSMPRSEQCPCSLDELHISLKLGIMTVDEEDHGRRTKVSSL